MKITIGKHKGKEVKPTKKKAKEGYIIVKIDGKEVEVGKLILK